MSPKLFTPSILACCLLLAGFAAAADKPEVVILATGGTIAGSAETGTQSGYTSGEVGVDILINAVPQVADLAAVRGEQISNVGSQDMSDAIWLKLAGRIGELQARGDVDGIVITHGTDTLEETAYFLDLVLDNPKPVVLTAAMRPSTALSADGPLNLFNAVGVAADEGARDRGVLVAVNDDIHNARAVTKTNTTDVQTFKSPERGLPGVSAYGSNRYFHPPQRQGVKAPFDVSKVEALPRVDVIYMTADASADLVDAAVAAGAKGIVTAGVGNGNMPAAVLEAVRRAVQNGVVVVRSSRVMSGSTGRNVEVDDDALGTVAAGDLNPAKARVLLKLALLQTIDAAEIQEIFENY